MENKESLIKVFEVPLKENGDYEQDSQYFLNAQWNENDKRKIEEVISRYYNSLDLTGTEKVKTSVGEVIIKHQKHPQVPRRKLIQGFLYRNTLSSALSLSNQHFSILSSLKKAVPTSLENDQEFLKYLEILDMLVKSSEDSSEYSKLCLFDSILQILLDSKNKYTENETAAERLTKVVDNIRNLYPANIQEQLIKQERIK